MKDCIAASVILLSLLFGLPWLTAEESHVEQEAEAPPVEEPGRLDEQVTLTVWDGEQVQKMTVAEYLPGVVRGEMPATFAVEALKAQAVTARTYLYYKVTTGSKPDHPDTAVCMSPDCCAAYTSADKAAEKWGDKAAEYEAKIQQAVAETDGQVLLYDGEPILAAFHSSSDGVTAASGDVWVRDLPYLASVTSPESADTVPNYYSVTTFGAEEFQQKFAAAHPEVKFGENCSDWVRDVTRNGSDRVEKVTIGGVTVEGTEVRSIFGLRSASFTVECSAQEVTFRVTGYGHGVGMSQYGANELAKQGKTWQEILHWYYTDVSIGAYAPKDYTKR